MLLFIQLLAVNLKLFHALEKFSYAHSQIGFLPSHPQHTLCIKKTRIVVSNHLEPTQESLVSLCNAFFFPCYVVSSPCWLMATKTITFKNVLAAYDC